MGVNGARRSSHIAVVAHAGVSPTWIAFDGARMCAVNNGDNTVTEP